MRLFVALDLEEEIRRRIALYLQGLSGFAPEARWAAAESLHVTLKFIGEQPEQQVPSLQEALASVQTQPISLAFKGYGFFPTARAPRVFWLGIEADEALPNLAAKVDTALAALAIPREEHALTPHLTLARSGSGAPRLRREEKSSSRFERLQKQLAAMATPDFGTMTAREFFLYRSQLSPKGSQYTKLAGFPLRG
jgi:RNA 2',3'-cyclic 3'-phosphodiesterase